MDDRQIQIIKDTFWPLLEAGVMYTLPLTLITFALGLIIAVITALVRLSDWMVPKFIASFYVWVIRGTPLLVQLFIIFYGLPSAGIILSPYVSAIIGLSLSVGAYGSEIARAAVLSIQRGQWEAAYSLGMSRTQALRRIILPQAARVSVPPFGNSFIALVKDTSLVSVITFSEMFRKSQEYVALYYEPLILYSEAAVIYLAFSTVLSVLQHRLEKRLERFSAV